ncbi:MAG: regulatory protein RecX [Bacteroidota bacterium]
MAKTGNSDSSNSDPAGIFDRISRYCAYQERCLWDVKQKLSEWKVPGGISNKITKKLKDEGFIDDERFAKLFARGKFRINKWGRLRIRYELKCRSIPDHIIHEALLEISEEDYRKTVMELILKKKLEIKPEKNLNIREKIITFVTGKGFEFDLTAEVLKELKI